MRKELILLLAVLTHYDNKITALLTSVDFSDFLQLTLPHNKLAFDEIYVITCPEDGNTQQICQGLGVGCFVTDAFGDDFNKGAAINEALFHLRQENHQWIMITDADIFWPIKLKDYIPTRFPDCLYGFPRRVIMKGDLEIDGENDFNELLHDIDNIYLGGNYKQMAEFDDLRSILPTDSLYLLRSLDPYLKVEEPEIFKAMGWNSGVASTKENPLPLGYGQLFNCQVVDHKYPEQFNTAAGCDSYFSSLWPEGKRIFLKGFTVLHIGPRMIHWDGRKRW